MQCYAPSRRTPYVLPTISSTRPPLYPRYPTYPPRTRLFPGTLFPPRCHGSLRVRVRVFLRFVLSTGIWDRIYTATATATAFYVPYSIACVLSSPGAAWRSARGACPLVNPPTTYLVCWQHVYYIHVIQSWNHSCCLVFVELSRFCMMRCELASFLVSCSQASHEISVYIKQMHYYRTLNSLHATP